VRAKERRFGCGGGDCKPPFLDASKRGRAALLIFFVKQFWLVKQEPSAYSWTDFVADGKTVWTGVRNYTARNNLRAMRKGDAVFFYHSVVGKEIVGVAKVVREAYPDPTAREGDWSAVDLAPEKALRRPVPLDQIKENSKLKEMALLRLSRLSVQPVTSEQFDEILRMAR
jgi:predicted RNA-binding protein with PUA-like domain